ncbi:MAG TPA: NIL domain-containing protein [Chthoniobacterales bacterium]|jgi:ABC-type methionine transport system ATPase subunit
MAIEKKRFWLDFPGDLVTEPIVYNLVKRFDLIPNIRQASVSQDAGIMSLEVEGEREKIAEAVQWLEQTGVKVEPLEINVIEG